MDLEDLLHLRLIRRWHWVMEEAAQHHCVLHEWASFVQPLSLVVMIQLSFHLQSLHLGFALLAEAFEDQLAYCLSD